MKSPTMSPLAGGGYAVESVVEKQKINLVIPALIGSFYLDSPLANWLAVILFTAAGVTDFFDGYLARARGEQSKLGRFLDPVADETFNEASSNHLRSTRSDLGGRVLCGSDLQRQSAPGTGGRSGE